MRIRIRWLPLVLVASAVALQLSVAGASQDVLPSPGRPWVLAIGDSITAGYTVDPHYDGRDHSWALQLRDHLAAGGTAWELYSDACPGETTLSYVAGGCIGRGFVPGLGGRSQRDAVANAIAQRGADLRLIVVELGTNDYFHARIAGGDVDAHVDTAALRVEAIVADLQRLAPGVPVIVANLYDPHGWRDGSWAQAVHMDARLAALAARRHAAVADFLHAITRPLTAPEDRCRLVDCADHDIHPTLAGQTALYQAVLAVLPASLR